MKSKQHFLNLFVCGCIAAAMFSATDRISAGSGMPISEGASDVSGVTGKVDAAKLMSRVAAKYRSISSYKCLGKSQHRSTFDGTEKSDAPISFKLDYTRGGSSFIRWEQDDQKKLFTINGASAGSKLTGVACRDFSTREDGLMIVSHAKAGWSLFGINFFVFRDELKMGKRYFSGLNEPFTVEEREETGRGYYLLTGSFRNVDVRETYWIDRETYLVTKIERLLTVHTKGDDNKDYVSEERTEETYSDIEIQLR